MIGYSIPSRRVIAVSNVGRLGTWMTLMSSLASLPSDQMGTPRHPRSDGEEDDQIIRLHAAEAHALVQSDERARGHGVPILFDIGVRLRERHSGPFEHVIEE